MKKQISFVLAILFCFLSLSACGSSGGKSSDYKAVIDKYVVANFEGDGEALLDLYPEKLLKRQLELDGTKKSELIQQYNSYMKEYIYALNELDKKWEYTYKITDEEDIEESELKETADYFEETAEIKVNLSAGKRIYISATLVINDRKYFVETRYFTIYQIDGVWCCFDDNLSYDIKQDVKKIK